MLELIYNNFCNFGGNLTHDRIRILSSHQNPRCVLYLHIKRRPRKIDEKPAIAHVDINVSGPRSCTAIIHCREL
jgi:hypothetical protein